jgi:hypothetical protein
MKLENVDWKQPEDTKEIRRPFTAKVEESVARAFIAAVKHNNLYVRETLVKLMREFAKQYGEKKDEP